MRLSEAVHYSWMILLLQSLIKKKKKTVRVGERKIIYIFILLVYKEKKINESIKPSDVVSRKEHEEQIQLPTLSMCIEVEHTHTSNGGI